MRVPQPALWSAAVAVVAIVAVAIVAVAIPAAIALLQGTTTRTEHPPAPSEISEISESGARSGVGAGVNSSQSPSAEVGLSGTPSPAPTAAKPTLAARLRTVPEATTQVIIVHAAGYSGTHAALETFSKVDGVWRQQFPAMAARIGRDGFSDNHTEGAGTTPTGVYAFSDTMYGIDPNPGVRYAYHRISIDDWWNENPDSPDYNTFQHTPVSPGGSSEALWTETVAYRHFAVVRYNIPVTGHARGSGIFVHVGTGRATAGCVSLPRSDLLRVLTWLDPAKSPRIVLSPDSALSRY